MQYAKMDLAKFTEQLNAGRYESRTGARRAIGKVSEWSDKDKAAAQALVNKRFGDDDKAPKAAKSVKAKAAKPAKRTAKMAAVKPVKVASTPTPKKAKRAQRGQVFAGASVSSNPTDTEAGHLQTNEAKFPRRTPITVGGQEPVSTARVTAYAGIIQAFKNVSPLTQAEQTLYEIATSECTVNESPESKTARLAGTPAQGRTKSESVKAPTSRKPTTNGVHSPATAADRPRIAVPAATPAAASGIMPMTDAEYEAAKNKLSPEEQASLDRLQKHVAIDVGPVPPPIG